MSMAPARGAGADGALGRSVGALAWEGAVRFGLQSRELVAGSGALIVGRLFPCRDVMVVTD